MGAVSLQNLSSFTLIESPTKVKNLAENAKKKGYSAIALTDINITYGLVDFYKAAKDTGIKPLLGMQLRINGFIAASLTQMQFNPMQSLIIGAVFGLLFAIIIPAITAKSYKDKSKYSKL